MPRPRKTIDAGGTVARLDGLRAAVRREADPFDDAMFNAIHAMLQLSETHSVAVESLLKATKKLERRTR